jgi:carbonic anhydrase
MSALNKRLLYLFAIFALFGYFCIATYASDETPGVTTDQALSLLKEGNARFVTDHSDGKDIDTARRTELTKGQHPFAAVLTCADSRVPPELIFNQGLGKIFVIRVAGNVLDTAVLGSVEYAVEHLHVPLVVVLGHEKCGAVTAALAPQKPVGNLGKLIQEIDVGSAGAGPADKALPAAIRNNALSQVNRMTSRSAVIEEYVREKKVKIVTGIYHLDDGKVEWIAE